jgi:preprotein translocase subunit YajC
MKIGDKIKTLGRYEGLIGTVTRIREGTDVQNHGTIEVRIEKITSKNYDWLNPGDLEHFAHFGWEKDLEIIG